MWYFDIEYRVNHNRHCAEHDVKELVGPHIIKQLPGEGGEHAVIKQWYHEQYVFVEIEADQCGIPAVALPAVHEQKSLQEVELADGVVRGPHGLGALQASDSDANMCGSYHIYVIRPVTDGQCQCRGLCKAHQLHHVCLLLGTHPATKHHPTQIREFHQQN